MKRKLIVKEYLKDNFYQHLDKWLLVNLLSDKNYLKWSFKRHLGYPLNLDNPQTFNEKLQWLKLNDIHPEYSKMVDKVEAKQYVASIIGEEYIIPTLGVWENVSDIDWNMLPRQFVIKVSSDSGGIVVCKDKNKLDISEAEAKLIHNWGRNYYKFNKEYPYRYVKPRIIAEQYIEDESRELKDYKFFCFNGDVKFFKIDFGRYTDHHANYYDPTGKLLPFGEAHYPPNPQKKLKIPKELPKMISLAETLSHGTSFLRVDLYNTNGKVFFGELTFFPASGMGPFVPQEWDYQIGKMLKIQ